jgi:hypothetical protein
MQNRELIYIFSSIKDQNGSALHIEGLMIVSPSFIYQEEESIIIEYLNSTGFGLPKKISL